MPPERTQRLDVRMAAEEMSMLEALAEAAGLTASDIVRTLVRREFASTIGVEKLKRLK